MSWAWVLLMWLTGFGLIVVELFMPGAVIGIVGTLVVAASVIVMYVYHGGLAGTGLLGGSLALGAVALKLGVARLAHRHTLTEETGYVGTDDLSELLGQTGVATTTLHPGGFATIGGKRIDVVSRGEHLEKGSPVVVIHVEGNVVEVRRQDEA